MAKSLLQKKLLNLYHQPLILGGFQRLFLSSSAVNEATILKSASHRKRERPAPIKLTPAAIDRIQELLKNQKDKIGIRLGVRRRGCNGLSYTMNYASEKPKHDEEVSEKGVRVFIEPMALFHIVGTTMDFEETELSSEFTFSNPNAKGSCGCGESFNT
mmetsp:Transcript_33985/g.44871  ORF Transcript_33985/g.44871 Transcript_33985/m.44871 type:complete len:158 (-) Transcript_33985:356-829(-)